MKVTAKLNGVVIAESQHCEKVEGNYYFPKSDVQAEFLKESSKTTFCGWKGTANYYHISINGNTSEDAAWYYQDPKPEAANIKDYIAFWGDVEVKAEN